MPLQIEATGESAEPEYKFEALVTLDKVDFRGSAGALHASI
jgi:hypothetical protein